MKHILEKNTVHEMIQRNGLGVWKKNTANHLRWIEKKKNFKNEDRLRKFLDNIKISSIFIIGV